MVEPVENEAARAQHRLEEAPLVPDAVEGPSPGFPVIGRVDGDRRNPILDEGGQENPSIRCEESVYLFQIDPQVGLGHVREDGVEVDDAELAVPEREGDSALQGSATGIV